jgi:hypothetical protein
MPREITDASLSQQIQDLTDEQLIVLLVGWWSRYDIVTLLPPEPGTRQLCSIVGEMRRRKGELAESLFGRVLG